VVAGGGGGGGSQTSATGGAGGGATGGTGGPLGTSGIVGGVGGTQDAGGGVGTCGGSSAPTAGTAGVGGDGGTSTTLAGGGGGGGGWFGGGGGGEYCGGGGGSGYFGLGTSNGSFGTDTTGTPSVTLSYIVNPTISVTAPTNGATYTQNQVVDAAFTCTAAAGTTLSSCSGAVATGAALATSTVGTHTFTVTALDADGGTATSTITFTVVASSGGGGGGGGGSSSSAPTLTAIAQKPARWRDRGPKHAKHKPPIGTKYTFTLSAAANVTLTFDRLAPGRKTGHKCLAPTRHNRRHHACTRTLAAGQLPIAGQAGPNTVTFEGKIPKHKPLSPGRYTVVISASNAGGTSAPSTPLRFTIVGAG
jgi:hypothetical protein